ncbi:hypothetical protein L6R53_08750 [Myxococcota bacterium]|nr:hypothetical protein [Myxococcota bacterium]
MLASSWHLPADTRPLREEELVDDDRRLLTELVGRLQGVLTDIANPTTRSPATDSMPWLAMDSGRTPRVVMVDGDRGTGKTSLLLTLLDRLQQRDAPPAWVAEIHGSVLPTRPLDFDPLPPGLPLLAWILQAFEPLVDEVTRLGLETGSARLDELDRRAGRGELNLKGQWQRLHDHAVVAWREPSSARGVPSPEEELRRVRTWGGFQGEWCSFVDELLAAIERCGRLGKHGVLLVPVDDVDLQITRAPELLRFLRLLQHRRVVFLVTGFARQLEFVLQVDVDGQERRMGGSEVVQDPGQRPTASLGRQSVEKTIPPVMRVSLSRLDLGRVLRWRGGALRKVVEERGLTEERRELLEQLWNDRLLAEPGWTPALSSTHRRLESLARELEWAGQAGADPAEGDALDLLLEGLFGEAPEEVWEGEPFELKNLRAQGLRSVLRRVIPTGSRLVLEAVPSRWRPLLSPAPGRSTAFQVVEQLRPACEGQEPRPLDAWLAAGARYLSGGEALARSGGVRGGAMVRSVDLGSDASLVWPSPWFPRGDQADPGEQAHWREHRARLDALLREAEKESSASGAQGGEERILCAWVRFLRGQTQSASAEWSLLKVIAAKSPPDGDDRQAESRWKGAMLALSHPRFGLGPTHREVIVSELWHDQRGPNDGNAKPDATAVDMMPHLEQVPVDAEVLSMANGNRLDSTQVGLLARLPLDHVGSAEFWQDCWYARAAEAALGPGAWALLLLGEMTERRSTRTPLLFHHGDDKSEDISFAMVGADRLGRWTGPSTWSRAGSAAVALGAWARRGGVKDLLAKVAEATRQTNGNAARFIEWVWGVLTEGKANSSLMDRVRVLGMGELSVDLAGVTFAIDTRKEADFDGLSVRRDLSWRYSIPKFQGSRPREAVFGSWLGLASSVAVTQQGVPSGVELPGDLWVLSGSNGPWPLPPLSSWVAWDRFMSALADAHQAQRPSNAPDEKLWWVAWYLTVGALLADDPWGPLVGLDFDGNMDRYWRNLRRIPLFKIIRREATGRVPSSRMADLLVSWYLSLRESLKEVLPSHVIDKMTDFDLEIAHSAKPSRSAVP